VFTSFLFTSPSKLLLLHQASCNDIFSYIYCGGKIDHVARRPIYDLVCLFSVHFATLPVLVWMRLDAASFMCARMRAGGVNAFTLDVIGDAAVASGSATPASGSRTDPTPNPNKMYPILNYATPQHLSGGPSFSFNLHMVVDCSVGALDQNQAFGHRRLGLRPTFRRAGELSGPGRSCLDGF
jgi:hypothetical protein